MTAAKPFKGIRIAGPKRELLIAEIKADYENGMSIRELAKRTGRAYGTVHRMLSLEAGVELRSRGGRPRQGNAS
jgi:transposase